MPAGDDAGDDRGHQPRSADLLGREGGDERHRERQHRVGCGVVDARAYVDVEMPGDDADDDGGQNREGELADRLPQREGRGGARDGGTEQHEGRRIVEQALAFEDDHHTRRDPHSLREVLAAASVGLMTAPSATPHARSRPGIIHAKNAPRISELTTTKTTESPPTAPKSRRRFMVGTETAAE